MASYINRKFTLADGESVVIPLNRWSEDDYSIQVSAGSALVEGTLDQPNRDSNTWQNPAALTFSTLNDSSGAPLTAVTDFANVDFTPLEAVRITATGATVGRFMQQGDC